MIRAMPVLLALLALLAALDNLQQHRVGYAVLLLLGAGVMACLTLRRRRII